MGEEQALTQQERVQQLRHLTKTDPDTRVRRRADLFLARPATALEQRLRTTHQYRGDLHLSRWHPTSSRSSGTVLERMASRTLSQSLSSAVQLRRDETAEMS